jgi:phage shock protein B
MDIFIPLLAIITLFIGLPWLIFHYVTKWKQAATLTLEDENLLDELHDIARRLDDRMTTIERLIAVDREQGARLPDTRAAGFNPQLVETQRMTKEG